MAAGVLIFTHILPIILGLLGVILLISGVMGKNKVMTILGVIFFMVAGILPFVVVPYLL